MAQEARRKTYNAIIRNIKDMLNKTLEDLEEEYKSYYPITQTERIYINGLFKQIEDLSDDNLQKCIQNTKKEIEQIIKKKESRINEIIKGISDEYIKKVFQDTILSTYKLEKLYSDIKIPTNRYHIDLKDKEDRDISFEDDNIKFLKDRVGEIQQSIEQNLSEKNKFSEEIKKLENKIEQQKRKSDLRYRKGLGELGTRPEPKQKYKTIKVKKFFFIKETKCVPDGLDRSEQYKWDEQKNRLDEQRDIDEKNINDLKRAVSMQQLRIKQLVRKENHLKEQREKTERAINTIEKGEIAFKKKNSDRYLARKKDDVVSCCTDLRRELLDQAITESEHYFNEYKKNIENNAKDAVEKAVKEYIARLKSDNENILQENPEIIQNKDYIKKITEIKEEIKL